MAKYEYVTYPMACEFVVENGEVVERPLAPELKARLDRMLRCAMESTAAPPASPATPS